MAVPTIVASGEFSPANATPADVHTFDEPGVYVVALNVEALVSTDAATVAFRRFIDSTTGGLGSTASTPLSSSFTASDTAVDFGPIVVSEDEAESANPPTLRMTYGTGADGTKAILWRVIRVSGGS